MQGCEDCGNITVVDQVTNLRLRRWCFLRILVLQQKRRCSRPGRRTCEGSSLEQSDVRCWSRRYLWSYSEAPDTATTI